jgi:hypothetical protein
MRIGLYNLEPQYVNTAMMQVSMYHRLRGDEPEQYVPLLHDEYDKIYAFSIFDFTPKTYVTKDMICGGTGFSVLSRLPPEIEACDYDYSIFPKCDHSIVWFSRGCSRNCGFCVVPRKEGRIQAVKPKPLNPKGTWIQVNDNNFFANPEWRDAIKQLQEWGQPIQIQQGVDARTLDREQAEALMTLKHVNNKGRPGYIHMAWDDPRDDLAPKLRQIAEWIPADRIMIYMLIGYNTTPEQDQHRVNVINDLGMNAFAMPYDKRDYYQKNFARYVNGFVCKKIDEATGQRLQFDRYKHWRIPQARKETPLNALIY